MPAGIRFGYRKERWRSYTRFAVKRIIASKISNPDEDYKEAKRGRRCGLMPTAERHIRKYGLPDQSNGNWTEKLRNGIVCMHDEILRDADKTPDPDQASVA